MSSNHYGRYPFGQRPAPGTGRTADRRTQGAQGQDKPQDERPSYAQPGQPGYRPQQTQQPGRPSEQTQQQAQREQAQQHAQQQVQREQAEREQAARAAAQEQAAEQESHAQQDEPLDFDVLDDQPDAAAEVLELQAQLAEAKDMLLRSHAETENVRRRGQEDVAKARKFAIESFAESLVPVCDSLEAALAQENQTLESLTEGVNITLKQLDGAFERNGLKEVNPAVGDKFDPHLQQAIASVPADQPPNTIVTVLQKGYLIGDRVLRPALVTVAAG